MNIFGRHDTAVSEHARLFLDGSATYDENGQLGTRVIGMPIIPPATPGGPVTPPILVPPTGDFLSVTGREYSFAAHAGGAFALGPRDSLSLSSGAELTTRVPSDHLPGSLAGRSLRCGIVGDAAGDAGDPGWALRDLT